MTGEAAADGTRLWAEQNGLGITLAFVSARDAIERQSEQVDRNAAYLASLPPAEAEAWVNALSGPAPEVVEGQRLAYEPGGCLGAALAEVYAQFEVVDQFADKLESLNARMASDPRVGGFVAELVCLYRRAGPRVPGPGRNGRRRVRPTTEHRCIHRSARCAFPVIGRGQRVARF